MWWGTGKSHLGWHGCVIHIYGVGSYEGGQPSGGAGLVLWEVYINTWLTLMAPVWRYLCPSALACGLVEVCVPSCDGWDVNWGRYDCMMYVFLNMGLYVLCVQVFIYMFIEMWKVVSRFMYWGPCVYVGSCGSP